MAASGYVFQAQVAFRNLPGKLGVLHHVESSEVSGARSPRKQMHSRGIQMYSVNPAGRGSDSGLAYLDG